MEVETTLFAASGLSGGLWRYAVKPFLADNPGVIGWTVTLGAASLYDAWALRSDHQTMSKAFHEGVDHPVMRFACLGALGGLAIHLAHGVH